MLNKIKKSLPALLRAKRCRRGFTLIEAMLALMILAVVSTVIISLSLQVTSLVNSTKLKNQKIALSQQMLEQVRGYYQQNGWAMLVTKAPSPTCYTDGTLTTVAVCDPTPLPSVQVKLTASGAPTNQIKADVTVNWTWKGQSQNVAASTYFYYY